MKLRAVLLLVTLALPVSAALAADSVPQREILELLPSDSAAKAVPASPEVVDGRPVALHLEALAEADGQPRLPLLDGAVYELVRTGFEQRGPGGFVWRGKVLVPGRPDGSATLTVMDGSMAGTLFMPDSVYEIVPTDGGEHFLLAIDDKRFLPCGGGELAPIPRRRLRQVAAKDGAPTRVDLLVAYTSGAVSAGSGERSLRLLIQNAVDLANTAFVNSRIDVRLNLVHVERVPYAETGASGSDLLWLRGDRNIANLRRTWGADVVSLVVSHLQDACGRGYLMDRESLSPVFSPYAYSVVDLHCAAANLTLAHEVGHNFGANHDPANSVAPERSAFPFAYGHFVDGLFRTVMSYPGACTVACPRIPYFSHPDLRYQGQSLGIPDQRDNHRTLNATREVVGAFQPEQACRPGPYNLCLVRNRFKVELVWENQFDGSSGLGSAIARTDLAGFFSFGDASNIELMVKVLDFGDVVKVFYGELTNLHFTLIVTDTLTGTSRVYGNAPGDCGAIDQSAFPGSAGQSLTLAEAAVAGKAGACRPGPGTLCLMNNRFQVTAEWRNAGNGSGGHAGAVPLSGLTGAFWFGDRNNLELLTKMLNLGDRLAFFYGTLSDLEYTITVTDTATGKVKTYHNDAGRYCGGLDEAVF